MMKKKLWILAAIAAAVLMTALPATAADVFAFTDKSVILFEGERAETALNRDGAYTDGDIVYTSDSSRVATVSEDGTITGVTKGRATVYASLMRDNRRIRRAAIEVQVLRRVTAVTLNRKNMTVLEADDPILADLLAPLPEEAEPRTEPVLVLQNGRTVNLNTICTPEDASSRKISYTSSDENVAKIVDGNRFRPVGKGECDLTVASVQNPEIQEHFHVVVIEPVKKIQVTAPDKTVFAGEQMILEAVCTPEDASIPKVTWKSNKPSVATVDENGLVTALSRGEVTIEARSADGTDVAGTIRLNVAQKVTKVTLNRKNLVILEPDDPILADLLAQLPDGIPQLTDPVIAVLAGRGVNLSAECAPGDANNRKVTYASSDDGIAKIINPSTLRGVAKGKCDLTVASAQNPEIQEHFHVLVIEPVKQIQITAQEKSVFAGEQILLSAACTPETASIRKVSWNSRNPSVATVDENGLVTGLKKGDATIEAKATDGTDVSATIRIHVAQQVTDIMLKESDVTVATARRVKLSTTVFPKEADNRKLNWSSSDSTVATVTKDGEVTGIKPGICVITCTSESNPAVSANAAVQVVQPVTKITFNTPTGQRFPIRESMQLSWNVEPDDASDKGVVFTSNHPEIASVDENGLVTGVKRGEARITATARDGFKRSADIRVVITQPVEGVQLPQQLYFVQRGRSLNVRATVLPKDANNQRVYWETGDESVAAVVSSGTSTGQITGGFWSGMTTVTAITEDGGFTASADVKVADFDAAVQVEGLEISRENKIRITLRNTADFVVERVYFHVDCYDIWGNPMVYNTDGITTGFDGIYPLALQSGDRSIHGQFWFNNWMETGILGQVVLTITGYEFENGQAWEIPEEFRIPTLPVRSEYYETAAPTPAPQETEEGDGNG